MAEGHRGFQHPMERLTHLREHGALPHCLLFHGGPGLGKRDSAFALAGDLLGRPIHPKVEEDKDADPIYVESGPHGGDFFWLRAKSLTSGLVIAQWQQLLRQFLSQAAAFSRVVVIENMETARADFQNALLKSIEEPPPGVVFILITTKRSLILPTILSRALALPFQSTAIRADARVGEASHLLAILGGDEPAFMAATLFLQGRDREALHALFSGMRLVARDLEALRQRAGEDLLCSGLPASELRRLLPLWSSRALQQVVQETLKGDGALRLHIRPGLVSSGLVLALRRAAKESR